MPAPNIAWQNDPALAWPTTPRPVMSVQIGNATPQKLTIFGANGARVEIDLATGNVVIHGNVNDAARSFWGAVQTMAPMKGCKP